MNKISFNLLTSEKKDPAELLKPAVTAFLVVFNLVMFVMTLRSLQVTGHKIQPVKPDDRRIKNVTAASAELLGMLPAAGFRISSLFNALEEVLPDGVLLREVRVSGKRIVQLNCSSRNSMEMKNLLEKLNQKPFGDAFLQYQKLGNGVDFRVECRFEG